MFLFLSLRACRQPYRSSYKRQYSQGIGILWI